MHVKKKQSWKEAPAFHLIGLLTCTLALVWAIYNYVERFHRDGWGNEYINFVIIYALLVWYFVAGAKSGLGEMDAVEEGLKEKNKGDRDV